MMAYPGKFQYMLLGKHKPLKIEIEGFKLESGKSVKTPGITIDYNLISDTHVSNVCETASAKIKSSNVIRNALHEKQVKFITFLFCHSLINVL